MPLGQLLSLLLATGLVLPAPHDQPGVGQSAAVRQLGFYVGTWNSSGNTRNAPTDRFVPVRTHETCSWVIGGRAVECREKVTSSAGNSDGIYVLGYDSAAKQYTVYGIDNAGATYTGVGNVGPAGEWSWTLQLKVGGETSNWRYNFSPQGPGARTMTLLLESPAGKWTEMMNTLYRRGK
jgi:hypothetical protein